MIKSAYITSDHDFCVLRKAKVRRMDTSSSGGGRELHRNPRNRPDNWSDWSQGNQSGDRTRPEGLEFRVNPLANHLYR